MVMVRSCHSLDVRERLWVELRMTGSGQAWIGSLGSCPKLESLMFAVRHQEQGRIHWSELTALSSSYFLLRT